MTAVIIDEPCTLELLNAVPIGGRVVRRYNNGQVDVFHRQNHPTYPDLFGWRAVSSSAIGGLDLGTRAILAGFGGKPVTVHHPGLIRVRQEADEILGRHWGWSCAVCGDGLAYLATAAVAGDWGRAHIVNHAEIARAI